MSPRVLGTALTDGLKVCSCKECPAGGSPQPAEAFNNAKKTSDGKMSICKVCSTRIASRWQKENPDRHASSLRLYRYGITQAQHDRMLYEQHESCAICTQPFGSATPCVDHCHDTGRVRGLLCSPCNTALGLIRESRTAALGMVDYIEFECERLPASVGLHDE